MRNKKMAAIIAALITVASMSAIPASATDTSLYDGDYIISTETVLYATANGDNELPPITDTIDISGTTPATDPAQPDTDPAPDPTDTGVDPTETQTDQTDTGTSNPPPTDTTEDQTDSGNEQQPTEDEPAVYTVSLNSAYTGGGRFVNTAMRVVIYDSLNTGSVLINKIVTPKDPYIDWYTSFPANSEGRYLMKTYTTDGFFLDNYNFFVMNDTFGFTERRIPESATLISNFDLLPYDIEDGSIVSINNMTRTDVGRVVSIATIDSSNHMINIATLVRNQPYALLVHDADGYITSCYTISISTSGKLTVKNGISTENVDNTSNNGNTNTNVDVSDGLVCIDDIVSETITTDGTIIIKDAKKRIVETSNISETYRLVDLSAVKAGGEFTMYVYDLADNLGYTYTLLYNSAKDMIFITKTYDYRDNVTTNNNSNTNTSNGNTGTKTQYTSTSNKPSSYTAQNTSSTSSNQGGTTNTNTGNTNSGGTKTSQTDSSTGGTKTTQTNSDPSSASGQPNTGNASSGSGQVSTDARNPQTGDDAQPEPAGTSHGPLYATLASSLATMMLYLTRRKKHDINLLPTDHV